MTDVEVKLWSHLRRRQVGGHKFRRQAPIGSYVADFVCFSARLVIEIDGPVHEWKYDERRDRWFHMEGYTVVRFPADDVFWRIDVVLEAIYWAVCEAPPPAFGRHLPAERGGD